jgi:hypothetical protein
VECEECGSDICARCAGRCDLCCKPFCLEHLVTHEGKPHCAACRDLLVDEAAQERAVAAIQQAPADERPLIAFMWGLDRVFARGGA